MPSASNSPWNEWIPGVLAKRQILLLQDCGLVEGLQSVDSSAFDLQLGDEIYLLERGSVKPKSQFLHYLKSRELARQLPQRSDGKFLLERKKTYLIKLLQRFPVVKRLSAAGIFGQATAKSSIGRLDVLARLIVDGMEGYEEFDREGIGEGTGDLYLELTPLTFPLLVGKGISLSQLRLFYGEPQDSLIRSKSFWQTVYRGSEGEPPQGELSLNLSPIDVCGKSVVGFKARTDATAPIDLVAAESGALLAARDYWTPVLSVPDNTISIEPGEFYILRSKERLRIPQSVAVYCKASDETLGEMRIHYAGFIHPGFGSHRQDSALGTPLIFEVRGHDFHSLLRHEERMAKLIFYRLSESADEEETPAYTNQELKLSKFFTEYLE